LFQQSKTKQKQNSTFWRVQNFTEA
jgi:hypothetical protein